VIARGERRGARDSEIIQVRLYLSGVIASLLGAYAVGSCSLEGEGIFSFQQLRKKSCYRNADCADDADIRRYDYP